LFLVSVVLALDIPASVALAHFEVCVLYPAGDRVLAGGADDVLLVDQHLDHLLFRPPLRPWFTITSVDTPYSWIRVYGSS
jgi:hypothetical protein